MTPPESPRLPRRLKNGLLFAAVLLAAFALRVAALNSIPAGLSHDEAYNGIAALEVLNGQYRVFYEINKGIEPLIIWLEGWAFWLWGIGPVQLRLVNVLAGMLTVALVAPLAARLFNRQVALLAVAGLAVSFWAIFVSRLTLRAVLLPPLLCLTLYFFWRALNPDGESGVRGRERVTPPLATQLWFALSGLFAGLAMYTYLAARFVPLIGLALFAYQFARRKIWRRHWTGLLLWLALWIAISAPLGFYFWNNAASFTERSGQVTTIPYVLNGDVGPLLRNTARTLGMFTVAGDTTDRYNLDGRPVFDWLNGAFFYLGLGLLVWRLVKSPGNAPQSVLLLSALFFMLLPDFITDDSPHFLRTIGALPVVYLLWALGLHTAAGWLAARLARFPTITRPAALTGWLVALLVTLTAAHTVVDYFIRWNYSPGGREIYGADIAAVAGYLKHAPGDDLPVISAEYYRDLDRFRFKLHFGGEPPFAVWFDGRQSLAFPPPGSGLSPRYIFPASAPAPDQWQSLLTPVPQDSGAEYTVYRLPAPESLAALQNRLRPVDVTVSDELVVRGVQIQGDVMAGSKFQVLVLWQALRALPPGTDYTFLAQLRDSAGRVWAQTDGSGFDPVNWQPGLLGLQLLTFRLSGDVPPRPFDLVLQLVDRRSGQPRPTAGGGPDVPLGRVTARLPDHPPTVDPARLPNPTPPNSTGGDGSGLQLRGYRLNGREFSAGHPPGMSLYWQVKAQPRQDYRLQFYLTDDAGSVVYRWSPIAPQDGEWPTSGWPAGYWVRDQLDLPTGDDAPAAGAFHLRGAWLAADGSLLLPGFDLGPVSVGNQ